MRATKLPIGNSGSASEIRCAPDRAISPGDQRGSRPVPRPGAWRRRPRRRRTRARPERAARAIGIRRSADVAAYQVPRDAAQGVQRPGVSRPGERQNPEREHEDRVEVIGLAEVVAEAEQVGAEDRCHPQARTREQADARTEQCQLPGHLDHVEQAGVEDGNAESLEQPDRLKERRRHVAPPR